MSDERFIVERRQAPTDPTANVVELVKSAVAHQDDVRRAENAHLRSTVEDNRRAIADGDQRLREHIVDQVAQIKSALDAAETIERTRIDALSREMVLVAAGSDKAIAKSEAANERRFESVNKFREQLADQAATFMPREVGDTLMSEMSKRIAATELRQSAASGETTGQVNAREAVLGFLVLLVGIAASVSPHI